MSKLVHDLATDPVHLGADAKARVQLPMTGPDWYEAYAERTAADGIQGRLVALHHFEEDWEGWEVHPHGDELVVCLSGQICVIQEHPDGALHAETLGEGQYLINPAGVWHTANVPHKATALFVTPGKDTRHRPRN